LGMDIITIYGNPWLSGLKAGICWRRFQVCIAPGSGHC